MCSPVPFTPTRENICGSFIRIRFRITQELLNVSSNFRRRDNGKCRIPAGLGTWAAPGKSINAPTERVVRGCQWGKLPTFWLNRINIESGNGKKSCINIVIYFHVFASYDGASGPHSNTEMIYFSNNDCDAICDFLCHRPRKVRDQICDRSRGVTPKKSVTLQGGVWWDDGHAIIGGSDVVFMTQNPNLLDKEKRSVSSQ
jgi:hypothetical protein